MSETFSVYVVVVEDTSRAFDRLSDESAIDLPTELGLGLSEDAARDLVGNAERLRLPVRPDPGPA